MKIRLLVSAGFVLFFIGAMSSATAQEPAFITQDDLLGHQCVDTEPAGDGWGWNGVCSCRTEAEFQFYGETVLAAGGEVILGSVESPGTCAGSGSISTYTGAGPGLPAQTQELVSSTRAANDRFGSYRTAVTGRWLAVASTSNTGIVTVYEKVSGSWAEVQVLRGDTVDVFNFGNQLGFLGNYLLVADDRSIYSIDTESWQKEVVYVADELVNFFEMQVDSNGFFVNVRATDDTAVLQYYLLDDDGFTNTQTLEFPYSRFNAEVKLKVDGDNMIIGFVDPQIDSSEYRLRLYKRLPDNTWAETGVGRNIDYYLNRFELFGRQLLVEKDGDLLLYTFGEDQNSYDGAIIINSNNQRYVDTLARTESRLLVSSSYHYQGAQSFKNVYVLEQDGAEWRKIISYRHNLDDSDDIEGGALVADRAFVSTRKSGLMVFDLSAGSASNCDYSNADTNNGWGWNNITRQSCEPTESSLPDNGCSYALASSFSGWGWNESTGESCPPTEQSLMDADRCDYRNSRSNGGWGWNAAAGQSCPPR